MKNAEDKNVKTSEVGYLIYPFNWEKKQDSCQSNENCLKWNIHYKYAVLFGERYYSKKNKKNIITQFHVMMLQKSFRTDELVIL